MSGFRIDWADLVTDGLLDRLAAVAGVPGGAAALRPETAGLVAGLLEATGGLAISGSDPGEAQRTRLAVRLLEEATLGLLAPARARPRPGWVLEERADAPPTARAVTRVPLNTAAPGRLRDLPGVGATLAGRIVAERRAGGPFLHPRELAERVRGIGEEMAWEIADAADLAPPAAPARPPVTGSLDDDLAIVVRAMPGEDGHERLRAALDAMTQRARRAPHPERARPRLDALAATGPRADVPVDAVEAMLGTAYHSRMRELLAAATGRVEVCMFHIALPAPSHPTAVLLDALVDAAGRGVAVRVLVDRDRPSDPYLSTVINAPAIARLRGAGVPVRVDAPEQLLHSKYVLVDDALTVIGSHNWSAGSFFQFDDLSLAVRSAPLTARQRARFDAQWAQGASP